MRSGIPGSTSDAGRGIDDGPWWSTIGDMWARFLAVAATIWTATYVVAYLLLIRHEGDSPAWWYVGLIAIGVLPLIPAVAGRLSRPGLIASAVVASLLHALVRPLFGIAFVLLYFDARADFSDSELSPPDG